MPHALNSYAPDGAWEEGPGYWAYATQYAVAGISAMDTALGTDFGLSDAPGLNDAGLFRIQSVGPTGLFFNFADAGEKAGDEPSLFWLATRFHQPLLAWAARQAADKHSSARDLIWYSAAGDGASLVKDGLDAQFVHANVVFMRSSWTDPNALYVGFKGGDNKANHAHLDLGTFVFDALGQRWVSDLGPDDYNLPGYFGKQRWDYYRLGTEGQNTLLIDGQNQNLKAEAPLIGYGSEPDGAFAIADLSDGYSPDHALQVHRGVALVKNRTELLVQDEIQILKPDAVKPFDLRWAIHTRAQIAVDLTGASATLTQKGQTVVARILAPAGATFVSEPVEIPAPHRPARGVSGLAIILAGVAGETRIAVVFLPQIGSQPGMSPTVTPLSGWNATHWH